MVIVYDLDDTLYDEIDFVKSGFKEISKYLQDDKYYDLIKIIEQGGTSVELEKILKTIPYE